MEVCDVILQMWVHLRYHMPIGWPVVKWKKLNAFLIRDSWSLVVLLLIVGLRTCEPIRKIHSNKLPGTIGSPCSTSVDCTSLMTNMDCNGTRCECLDGYHQTTNGSCTKRMWLCSRETCYKSIFCCRSVSDLPYIDPVVILFALHVLTILLRYRLSSPLFS